MKVITRVNEYLDSDKEIYIESLNGGSCVKVKKEQNFFLQFGEKVANTKVKRTDITETLVTILI
ncbi:hypothetical protein LXJ15735_27800 [Lacrimispora xylanolytica]